MEKKKNIIIFLLVCLCLLICNLTFMCVHVFADEISVTDISSASVTINDESLISDKNPTGECSGSVDIISYGSKTFKSSSEIKVTNFLFRCQYSDSGKNYCFYDIVSLISANGNDLVLDDNDRNNSGENFYMFQTIVNPSGINYNGNTKIKSTSNISYYVTFKNVTTFSDDVLSYLRHYAQTGEFSQATIDIKSGLWINGEPLDETKSNYSISLPNLSNVWGDFFDNSLPLRKPLAESTKFMIETPDNVGSGFSGILRFYDEELQGKNYGLMLNIDVNLKAYYTVDVPGWYEALHPLTNFDKTENITLSYKVDLNNIDSVFRSDLNKYFFNFGNELFPCDYDNAKSIYEFYKGNAKEYIKKYDTVYRRPFWNVDSVSISGFIYDDLNKCKSDTFTVAFSEFDKSGQSNKSFYSYKDSLGKNNTIPSDNTSGNIKDMTNKDGSLTDYAKDNNWSLEQELNKEENQQKVSFKSSLKDMRDYAEMFIDYLKDMFVMLPYFVWSLLAFIIAFVAVARVLGR